MEIARGDEGLVGLVSCIIVFIYSLYFIVYCVVEGGRKRRLCIITMVHGSLCMWDNWVRAKTERIRLVTLFVVKYKRTGNLVRQGYTALELEVQNQTQVQGPLCVLWALALALGVGRWALGINYL